MCRLVRLRNVQKTTKNKSADSRVYLADSSTNLDRKTSARVGGFTGTWVTWAIILRDSEIRSEIGDLNYQIFETSLSTINELI